MRIENKLRAKLFFVESCDALQTIACTPDEGIA
jgi:hypothetical protein